MKNHITILLISTLIVFSSLFATAQDDNAYQFRIVKQLATTPVKDQQRTGTCWSYATTSFLESEIIRMGKPEVILSPMFFVRHAYANKAGRYVRFHGANNFGQGGQAHDVIAVIAEYGALPESAYAGNSYGESMHVHSELATILSNILDAVVKNPNRKLSTAWQLAYNNVLDAYFGPTPNQFTANGKSYTPKSFAEELGLELDSYIELTSYSHQPFYQPIVLEVPDNWAHKPYYNIPIDELMEIMNNAIENGYTVCWDGDTSEKGFAYRKGLAVLPQVKITEMSDSEQAKWAEIPEDELTSKIYEFSTIVPEVKVTQELRQQTFDNYTTTDDHLMHITGISKDQNGNTYYLTKNSWGSANHIFDGYLHMSEQYVRMKTVAIMVHKDALPNDIAKKLGVKR